MNTLCKTKIQLINYITTGNHYKLDKYNYDTMKLLIYIDNDDTLYLDMLNEISMVPMITTVNDKLQRYEVLYTGINITDILALLYDEPVSTNNYEKQLDTLYEHYISLLYNVLNGRFNNVLTCKFRKTLDDAVIPSKKSASDAGYDLTIIKEVKKISKKTSLYDTGISVTVPLGFYTLIHARSSMVKSGYMLSNSTGIIDSSYNGNLLIALTKIDDELPDLVLPLRCAQLILQRHYHYLLEESTEELAETVRNADGGIVRSTI
jgi:dUTP pyrophosphatase